MECAEGEPPILQTMYCFFEAFAAVLVVGKHVERLAGGGEEYDAVWLGIACGKVDGVFHRRGFDAPRSNAIMIKNGLGFFADGDDCVDICLDEFIEGGVVVAVTATACDPDDGLLVT